MALIFRVSVLLFKCQETAQHLDGNIRRGGV